MLILSREQILMMEHELKDMCSSDQPVSEEKANWLNAVAYGIGLMTDKLLEEDEKNESF